MTTFSQILSNSTDEQLLLLSEDLTHISLAASIGGSYRDLLKKRRQTAKGGIKIIYAALYKSKASEQSVIADKLLSFAELIKQKKETL